MRLILAVALVAAFATPALAWRSDEQRERDARFDRQMAQFDDMERASDHAARMQRATDDFARTPEFPRFEPFHRATSLHTVCRRVGSTVQCSTDED